MNEEYITEEPQLSPEEIESQMRTWLYGNASNEQPKEEDYEEVVYTEDYERMEKEQELLNLIASLSSSASPIGDWKVAKCYEYKLAGLEPPYDVAKLHADRQAVRDRINELQEELK